MGLVSLSTISIEGGAWADLSENPHNGEVAASVPGKMQIYGSAVEPKLFSTDASQGGLLYSSDGKALVLDDNNVSRTLVYDGQELHTISHPSRACSRVVSPDGKLLAVALTQGQVEIYSLNDYKRTAAFSVEGSPGRCNLQFAPNGKSLITCGDVGRDCSVQSWDCATGKSLGTVLEKAPWRRVRIVAGGQCVLADSGKDAELAQLGGPTQGKVLRRFPGFAVCDASPDGKIAALGKGHDVQVLGMPGCSLLLQLGSVAQGEGRYPIPRVEIAPGGQVLTFWTTKSSTQIWNVPERRKLFDFPRQAYVSFSGSKDLAAIIEDGYVDVLSLRSGKLLVRLDSPVKANGQNEALSCLLTRDDKRAFVQWNQDQIQQVQLPAAAEVAPAGLSPGPLPSPGPTKEEPKAH